MARIFKKSRSLRSRASTCRCLLLVVVAVALLKLCLVVPMVMVLRGPHDFLAAQTSAPISNYCHPDRHGHNGDPGAGATRSDPYLAGPSDPLDPAALTWMPDPYRLARICGYLGLALTEMEAHLPLTLKSAVQLGSNRLCGDEQRVDALFLVHTAPKNFRRRLQMRGTIFKQEYLQPFTVRVVFLVGRTAGKKLQKALEYEHGQYGDLLQGNFIDSYRNLSHKGVMGFRWMSEHCAGARHVVKMDDDVFFDTFKLLMRYRALFGSSQKTIFCNVLVKDSMIIHRQDNRWAVDESHFGGMDRYPIDYCSGFAVVISGDLVPHLYRAAMFTPVFWIDDLYLFGMLPQVAGGVTLLDLGYDHQFLDLRTEATLHCLRTRRRECPTLATLCYSSQDWEELWNLTYHQHVDVEWRVPYLNLD